jgi:signal peptidase II
VNEPALEPTTAHADGPAVSSADSGSATPAARPSAARIAVRGVCVALIVAADLASKAAIFAWLEPLRRSGALAYDVHGHPRYTLVGDWLAFMLSTNPGAAFGQLESFPYLLVGGRIVAAIFLVYLLARSAPGRALFNSALVLVLGGALGNLYDNLFLNLPHEGRPFGPVRDFIDVYFRVWDWHFPTFNLADSCITIGAVLLLISGLVGERAAKKQHPPPPAPVPR